MTELASVERALDAIQAEIARANMQRHQWASESLRLLRALSVDSNAAQRLDRIAAAHTKQVRAGGLTDGYCTECGCPWPCPTRLWATTDRDPAMDTWEPRDDDDY